MSSIHRSNSFFHIKDKTLFGFDNYNARSSNDAFVLQGGVETISSFAFLQCKTQAFVLPDGLKKICTHAFDKCENLKMIFIPKSVEIIGDDAFWGCNNLTVYCEGEPKEGWLDGEPYYTEEQVTTAEDYAFDFHRGGVSYSTVQVKHSNCWNPAKRPVKTNVTREEFIKELREYLKNN